MVLEELGSQITRALAKVQRADVIDESLLQEVLKDISNTLMRADVDMKLVMQLAKNIKQRVNLQELAGGLDKRKVIEEAVEKELVALLDCSGTVHQPKRGKASVVMFVGLQGNGKTTTCMKYAYHYKKKGYKPAMVCADTYRAGAFDQLKQNATRAQVPFYGSYSETDPARIAAEGVERFKSERRDLIIVDTSGRHSQSEALFEEMRQVAAMVDPDLIIFVMDGTTGQSAGDQARAFNKAVEVGAVIITKMDGSSKGGSTLSAVAATNSPVVFLGTGEHMDALEPFKTEAFVSRLLGKGDLKSLAKKLEEVMPEEKQQQFMDQVSKGNFNMRFFREFIENVGSMGPLSSVMNMMPMFSQLKMPQQGDRETQLKFKKYITIMDSMTNKELDEPDVRKLREQSRILRFARGSGCAIEEVIELLGHYELMMKSASKLSKVTKGMNPRNMQQSLSQITQAVPPQLLKQMGGMQGLQSLMKGMPGGGGLPGLK